MKLIEVKNSYDNLIVNPDKICAIYVTKCHESGKYHRVIYFYTGAVILDGDKPFDTKEEALKKLKELSEELQNLNNQI